ncbi:MULTISPECIES: RNA polymerase sigma factor SigJ [unclassified Leifsonia]|uniref:RNA polymerase sigma factor SigJ n=1 Tax=unclassified Leifsonia TaxID=2663824 RepID=UPI0009EA59D7|nr:MULTISPECIES: RNA polymerase sigma factor SigJ [unclassified Leifsonia]
MVTDQNIALVDGSDALAVFGQMRRRLFGIAYRITGTVADAEDVLQDAWIRWQLCDRSSVRDAPAFLATIVTRLAINVLSSAHSRRETYIGPWLPAPVDTSADPTLGAEREEALQLATMIVMETLTPSERAAYVLREAFDYPYDRIAEVLSTTEVASRKLVSRARKRMADAPMPTDDRTVHADFLEAFLLAARTGDISSLENLLAVEIVSYTDGGGHVRHTARRPITGREKVVRFLAGLARWFWNDLDLVRADINGRPSVVLVHGADLVAVLSITVQSREIAQLLWMMNPGKLEVVASMRSLQSARGDWIVAEAPHRPALSPSSAII